MSFRLFVYYCALVGGWSALAAWLFGRALSPANELGKNGVRGLFLGMLVALGLGLVDALWNYSARRPGQVLARVGVAVLVGGVGGLVGGLVGYLLYDATNLTAVFVLGWTLTGLLIGASVGVFEVLVSLVRRKEVRAARGKLFKCLLGGTAGGLLGGLLALFLRLGWGKVFDEPDRNLDETLWTPNAFGFVALGTCIGLLVGLAQVILKEAWVKVEAGFRPGRELVLAKERTTMGRAEGNDIGLFGDQAVEKQHASIVRAGNRFYLEPADAANGTTVNDQPVKGRTALRAGDLIRVGKSALRFHERQRRASES